MRNESLYVVCIRFRRNVYDLFFNNLCNLKTDYDIFGDFFTLQNIIQTFMKFLLNFKIF